MINIPKVKLGVVAVSRDCFPIDLSERRRAALMQALKARGVEADPNHRGKRAGCQKGAFGAFGQAM